MRNLLLVTIAAGFLLPAPAAAQTADAWSDFRFLLGNWVGVGKGSPGEGSGSFSFELTLDGNALIRKSHSEYPATKDRPAAVHEDLMVIYREGGAPKALYVDNEKHVIHYDVTVAASPRTVTLTSPVVPNAPRYRFVYTVVDGATVKGRFEVAPPDKPEAFATYVEGDAKKVK